MLADLFELGKGGGLAVDKAAAFTFGVDNAADAELVALVEQAFNVKWDLLLVQDKLQEVMDNTAGNTAPAASNLILTAHAFAATSFVMRASDADGHALSYRLVQKPTNGWVFGSPPSNLVYKSKPGVTGGARRV